jgi:hypothetical protein
VCFNTIIIQKSFFVLHEKNFWSNELMTAAAIADNRAKSFSKVRSWASFSLRSDWQKWRFSLLLYFSPEKKKVVEARLQQPRKAVFTDGNSC